MENRNVHDEVDELVENHIGMLFRLSWSKWRKKMGGNSVSNSCHRNGYIDQKDLVSWGFFGLLDAAKRYRQSDGVLFSTFAKHRILGAIEDGFRGTDKFSRLLTKSLAIVRRDDPSTTPEEMENAKRVLSEDHAWRDHYASFSFHFTENMSRSLDSENNSYYEKAMAHGVDLKDRPARNRAEAIDDLVRIGNLLSDRERFITRAWAEGNNMRDIGHGMGISESRVCQIAKKANEKLGVRRPGGVAGRSRDDAGKVTNPVDMKAMLKARMNPCHGHGIAACLACPDRPEE